MSEAKKGRLRKRGHRRRRGKREEGMRKLDCDGKKRIVKNEKKRGGVKGGGTERA